MEILWPILLLISTFAPWMVKIWYWGEPIVLEKKNFLVRFVNMFFSSLLTYILLYLCGFFLVIGWPQIVWIVLTGVGFFTFILLAALCYAVPGFVENMQSVIDRAGIRTRIDLSDIFTYGLIIWIYWCGGAFVAF